MSRIPKFNFIPEQQLNQPVADAFAGASIRLSKMGILMFNNETLTMYDLEGKRIRLFADREKLAVGFKIIEGNTTLEDLDDSRTLNRNSSGIATVGITKMLKRIGYPLPESTTPPMPLMKYASVLMGEMYYIQLPPVEAKIEIVREKE